jgi:hypothetical protein
MEAEAALNRGKAFHGLMHPAKSAIAKENIDPEQFTVSLEYPE